MLTATPILAALLLGSPSTEAVTKEVRRLPEGYSNWGLAVRVFVPIFSTYEPGRRVVGRMQRGDRLPVRPAKTERTCSAHKTKGKWLATPGGYLCTASGVAVGMRREELKPQLRRAKGDRPMPFTYVKATPTESMRYKVPRVDASQVAEVQTKAYFLAVDRPIKANGRRWIRTVYGEYLLADETKPVATPTLKGLELDREDDLPLAFVTGPNDSVLVRCIDDDRWSECGTARKFSSFRPRKRMSIGGEKVVLSRDGRVYPGAFVRIARTVERPKGIPKDARWIHIDLDQQIFVAYEGDEPRYTSLVSTGVKGHDTPVGVFQVQRKYLTKTMKGPDDAHGRYRVEEIPYVMYYDGNYAVHGAYWHETFGYVRSHGCTNVAPVDAMWLYNFDTSAMTEGWHANLRARGGMYVYVTQADDPTS